MNMQKLIIVSIFLAIGISAAQGQSNKTPKSAKDAMAMQGHQQLKQERFGAAQRSYTDGYRLAEQIDDEEWKTRFLFYLGNTYLAAANKVADSGESIEATDGTMNEKELANNAAAIYQHIISQRQESGSAKVNMARALTILGENKAADTLYQQAIALEDKKQLQYLQQYAAFLVKHDEKSAIPVLRDIVWKQPKSRKAHRTLMEILQKPKYLKQLPDYLAELLIRGEVLRVQDIAIEVLQNPDLLTRTANDLALLLADSLAAQQIVPASFADSNTARQLQKIAASKPELKDCMLELVATLSEGKAVQYRWWNKNAQRSSALSALLRSIGKYYDHAGETQRAESVLRDAVEVQGANDPKAMTELVDFYAKHNELEKINEVSETYESQLFRGKGQAYRDGNDQAIYEYHRTLASIYSYQASKTGDWGSSSNATSAVFQLENAYRAAKRSKTIVPDTKLVTNLAASYDAKGNSKKANTVRLESAKVYKNIGNTRAADRVLGTVNKADLSNRQLKQYEKIKVAPAATDVGSILGDEKVTPVIDTGSTSGATTDTASADETEAPSNTVTTTPVDSGTVSISNPGKTVIPVARPTAPSLSKPIVSPKIKPAVRPTFRPVAKPTIKLGIDPGKPIARQVRPKPRAPITTPKINTRNTVTRPSINSKAVPKTIIRTAPVLKNTSKNSSKGG